MPLPELDNLVRVRQLKTEPATQSEVDGLLHSASRRLHDARRVELSAESRFDLAYNAAHAASLRWHGYRSENRYTVFQCLVHTLRMPREQWRILDSAHRKRNLAEYEGDIDIDQALLTALIRTTQEVLRRVAELGPVQASN